MSASTTHRGKKSAARASAKSQSGAAKRNPKPKSAAVRAADGKTSERNGAAQSSRNGKAKRAKPPKGAAAPKADPKQVKRTTPAPTDDDITPEVLEFIAAIDAYKRRHGRPFPNWSEILKILKGLGYRRD